MSIKIVISSGKGGTGKTFVSTNIAKSLENMGSIVTYLDCDVEEPNGHLFLKPIIKEEKNIYLISPVGIDPDKCTRCGKCVSACKYNAIALVKEKVLFFKNLCHVCGACKIVCPEDAIIEKDRKIGILKHGISGNINFHYGLLETGEGGMTPRVIKQVKECVGEDINILDSPPGTSCPVVETVKNADLCVLVTDPTPFGINDLGLAVDMCRELGQEPVVFVNRAEYLDNNLQEYCEKEKLEIIGEIPDDRKIAECYSEGNLAVDHFSEYKKLFSDIALKIIDRSKEKRSVAIKKSGQKVDAERASDTKCIVKDETEFINNSKEVVVISGKGGTGKTSLTASFCALEEKIAISDCDVDAADLHLILKPENIESGDFSGGDIVEIDKDKCTGCGRCFDVCKFDAISNNENGYTIDSKACEGCGACTLVCKDDALVLKRAINGRWFVSDTRFGPMSHAKLGVAEENSGKLVSLIRKKKNRLASEYNLCSSIIDGSPGTGCPVIASVTGTDYAVIVTEPTVSGIHDLKRILDVIKFFRLRAGVIINKSDLNLDKSKEIKKIAEDYQAEMLGMIPYDKAFTEAQAKGLSIVEFTDNRTTDAIKEIWSNINNIVFS